MKNIVVGVTALVALLGTPALGADMPVKAPVAVPPPAYNWGGCYVGADVGYAWQRDKDTETDPVTGAFSPFSPAPSNPYGVKGGGYLGCNVQVGPAWVLGIEGDIEAASIGDDQGIYNPSFDFYESRTHSQSSIRARIGYAFYPSSLFYVTGGAAFARIQDTYVGLEPNGLITNFTDNRTGWTAGVGWEYAFTGNWIGRVEYRHADFGNVTNHNFLFCVTCAPSNETHRTTEDAIRFGIAYKFGLLH